MQSVLVYSLDSFFGALAIGVLDRSETTRRKLIPAFAACDLIATLAGASFRSNLAHIDLGGLALFTAPLFVAAVAVAVLTYGQKLPAGLVWIPVLLSVDNFFCGSVARFRPRRPVFIDLRNFERPACMLGICRGPRSGPGVFAPHCTSSECRSYDHGLLVC